MQSLLLGHPLHRGQEKPNHGYYSNHAPCSHLRGPQASLPLHRSTSWGPLVVRESAIPRSCRVCVRVCVLVSVRSTRTQRPCAHAPVLRKSKIAASLNSFPLAARPAFVLQTKRKRNETEGSEEAGEGGREGARAKEQTEEEGNSKGEREEGKASRAQEGRKTAGNTERQAWEPGGKPPSTHALSKGPPLPPVTKA